MDTVTGDNVNLQWDTILQPKSPHKEPGNNLQFTNGDKEKSSIRRKGNVTIRTSADTEGRTRINRTVRSTNKYQKNLVDETNQSHRQDSKSNKDPHQIGASHRNSIYRAPYVQRPPEGQVNS